MTKNRRRKSFCYTQFLPAPPENVFPLLCPVLEYDWIDIWECEMMYTDSGVAELDCLFRTNIPHRGEEIWMVVRYAPYQLIEFARFSATHTTRYTITVAPVEGGCEITWAQVLTALHEGGDKIVAQETDTGYTILMRTLCLLLEHYLRHGEKRPFAAAQQQATEEVSAAC